MGRALAVAKPDAGRVLTQALVEAAARLGIGTTDLKAIVGVSQPTASRLLRGAYQLAPGSKPFELATHLLRLYRSLAALVGGDDALAVRWLRSANRVFDDARPIDAIKRVDGLLYACEYLDAHRARV
jgi:uncharacterized protein (DUF2384 family)